MAANNAAELLIRIAADPSGAEQSIEQFRTSFGGDLSGITTDLARWSAGGSSEFARVQNAAVSFGGKVQTNFNSLNQLLNTSRQSSSLWRAAFLSDMQAVQNSSLLLQETLVQGFMVFDTALARNTVNAIVWQKSIGAAFQKAAITAVSAIAQEAIVRVIYSTALGFYLLAIRDFSGAAQAFESAALFGAVGGAAALAGRALAGSAGGSTSSGTSAPRSASSSSTAKSTSQASSSQQAAKQQTVQVIFQGPVYGGQAGMDELVRNISQAVTDRDANLVAYTVVRQPATRA
jgi:hypothetical protein